MSERSRDYLNMFTHMYQRVANKTKVQLTARDYNKAKIIQ